MSFTKSQLIEDAERREQAERWGHIAFERAKENDPCNTCDNNRDYTCVIDGTPAGNGYGCVHRRENGGDTKTPIAVAPNSFIEGRQTFQQGRR